MTFSPEWRYEPVLGELSALFLREGVCLLRSGRLSGQVSTVKHTAEKIWSFKYCVKCANLTTVVKRPLFKSPREQAK